MSTINDKQDEYYDSIFENIECANKSGFSLMKLPESYCPLRYGAAF